MEDKIKLSFHVCSVPSADAFYIGVTANYDAYEVSVPTDLIPAELLKIIKERNVGKVITGIAVVR